MYYLTIYKSGRTQSELHLNNYAFKYFNGKTEEDLIDFNILGSPEISIAESKEDSQDVIKCTFNRIDIPDGNANITYFFKVVRNETHLDGEEINTIALFESPYYTIYERNPKYNNDGKITLTAKGLGLSNWVYLNVIAQIQQNNILEYVSYNGKVFIRPSPDKDPNIEDDDGGNKTVLFLVVGGILILIVVALGVAIFIFQQRNKALLNQVKHVSFQQTNTNSDPNLLLQNKNINN